MATTKLDGKPWADGPFPLLETPSKTLDVSSHPAIYIANEMANAHNCMIRGLNAIILQCSHVTLPKDIADLLFLTWAWSTWIMEHHRMEERTMFPGFEGVLDKPGVLGTNVDQHHAFSAALEDIERYTNERLTNTTEYDPAQFRAKMEALATPLCEHLSAEIGTLLNMKEYCEGDDETAQKLLDVYRTAESESAKQDKSVVPPMVMGLRDKSYQGGNAWPQIPGGMVTEFLIANVLSWKHSGAWRFLPCDHWGRPRALPFAG